MSFPEILLIAIGLAMDAFAVSLGAGASGKSSSRRAIFRISFHFGLFQFFMPILGWMMGSRVAPFIVAIDHWIAFGLLFLVGVRMIKSGTGAADEQSPVDPSRGMTLVSLSIATSIDAFAVGLTMAMLHVNIFYPSLMIGLVAAALSLAGIQLGGRLGARFGKGMEIAGGVLLLVIGLRILAAHLLNSM